MAKVSRDVGEPKVASLAKVRAAKLASAAKVSPPQGRAETAAEKAAGAVTGGIVSLRKSALSLDVGPRVINALFHSEQRLSELTEEMHALKGAKRYEQLTALTLAIQKAAKADSSIDLTIAYSGDTKAMARLNDQLGVALGFREVKLGEPDKNGIAYDVVVTSQAVKDAFPMPGENEKNCVNFARKNTFRSNFMTQLKKCTQAAHALVEKGIEAKFDEKAGTMMISGPAVKKHFGQERVLLDEKKTVGTGDAKVELSEKPSFTALANIGGAAVGASAATGAGGAQHRGNQPGTVAGTLAKEAQAAATGKESVDAAIVIICKSLHTALTKASATLSKAAIGALEEVANAIEVKLANSN